MKQLLLSTFFVTALFTAQPAISTAENDQPPLPDTWTSRDAVQFAISGNPDNLIAIRRIEEAQAQLAIARSEDFPVVVTSAQYSQTDNPMYSFGNILNQGAFSNSIDFNDPGRTDDLQLKAEVRYRFYNGGMNQAAQDGAQAGIEAAQTDRQLVEQQLGFEAIKAFQAIVQAERMVTVREESLAAISGALKVGKARYDAGDLLLQDLLNIELQQSRASESLIRSRHALELARRGFLNLLGLHDKDLRGTLQVADDDTAQPQLPTEPNYTNRLELKKLDIMEAAAQAKLSEARGAEQPSVDGFASYQFDNGWELGESGDSWMAGVVVNYNLYDGGRTQSRISLAQVQIQKIQAQRSKTELALSLDVEQARLDYEQARQRLVVTEKMVKVAEEVTRLSRARFKEGVILASDLVDFETRLSDAQASHLAAQSGYRIAIANLRRAAGLKQF